MQAKAKFSCTRLGSNPDLFGSLVQHECSASDHADTEAGEGKIHRVHYPVSLKRQHSNNVTLPCWLPFRQGVGWRVAPLCVPLTPPPSVPVDRLPPTPTWAGNIAR
uniref:Uncharacterized protein n=1 Tax=Timema douglasi TaxID=61478 RepID=A0A7R8VF45_TIMDO|nr:unnamed protein product [Timema douglasi]